MNMIKYIKILHPVTLYSSHEEDSKTSDFLHEGVIVELNREKRRNGINWMEIYLKGKKNYIKKDFSKIYILKKVKLTDDSCTVVFYKSKIGENYDFHDVFTPHQFDNMDQETIKMKRIFDHAQKEKYINLYYNKTAVEVSKRILAKGEEVIITNEQGMFLEVMYGKRFGYILSDVGYYEAKNWWMIVVAILVLLGIMGSSLYSLIDNGWTIGGSILIIPALIITAVVIICIKTILVIFNFIFQNIRKRL